MFHFGLQVVPAPPKIYSGFRYPGMIVDNSGKQWWIDSNDVPVACPLDTTIKYHKISCTNLISRAPTIQFLIACSMLKHFASDQKLDSRKGCECGYLCSTYLLIMYILWVDVGIVTNHDIIIIVGWSSWSLRILKFVLEAFHHCYWRYWMCT